MDLLVPTKVTGVITQGAKDFGHVQFVGSYKVAYSNDGERWTVYQDEKQGKDKVSNLPGPVITMIKYRFTPCRIPFPYRKKNILKK